MSVEGIDNIIEHYGTKGMKWGVRKRPSSSGRKSGKGQQNRNTTGLKKGSDSGQKAPSTKKYKGSRKAARKLSDQQLQDRLKRLNMEKQYRDLVKKQNPPSAISRGSKKVGSIMVGAGTKALRKQVAEPFMSYALKEAIKKSGVRNRGGDNSS